MKVLGHARELPLGLLVRKGAARLKARLAGMGRARRDARDGTYLKSSPEFVPLGLPEVEISSAEAGLMRALAERYAAHRFDLLGSGWVEVAALGRASPAGAGRRASARTPMGAERRASARTPMGELPVGCREEASRIRSLIEGAYTPIDWQLDFKSGFRWSESMWSEFVPYGHAPGVDVKVPWELARLQHVPVLVLAARSAEPAHAARWRTEAVNQMLDFVAANPPRFGVNWRTAMDVGIRAANMALAMDLLCQDGVRGAWEGVLARSLEEHARHILDHLEWSPDARGNHYLANVAGVVWCAAHLRGVGQSEEWLAWGTRELDTEMRRQFHGDGSNFEASVCYHRLSAEMAAWTLACLIARGRKCPIEGVWPVPALRSRLAAMALFTGWATKRDGRVAQIGDNDSGRFFRLPGEFEGLEEQPLCHRETLDVLRALCGHSGETLAGRLAEGLGRLAGRVSDAVPMPSFGVAPELPGGGARAEWHLGPGCWEGLETAAFPDFGLFVWRSPRVWMAVRCGPVGQGGIGGHAHNDALHLELTVDGVDWIADPGTGVYTPDPRLRNAYRSAAAHFVPRPAGRQSEPAPLSAGLFRLADCGARCHRFGPESFVGSHDGYGARMWRVLELAPDGLVVRDVWEGGEVAPIPHVDAEHPWRPIAFSPGYGRFDA